MYKTWHQTVQIQRSVLWGNKVHYQILGLTCKFLLNSYVLQLYLTEITSGATSRVYETWHPTLQLQHLILWKTEVHHEKLRLTSKFLLVFYVLVLYLTEIASGVTS